jgi:L-malate glycosyltransferase
MAAGLPVVATDVGDIAAMVAPDNRRFIVPPQDEAGFVDALTALLASPDRRHALGAANRERVGDAFSVDRMVAAYDAVFSDDRSRGPPIA